MAHQAAEGPGQLSGLASGAAAGLPTGGHASATHTDGRPCPAGSSTINLKAHSALVQG